MRDVGGGGGGASETCDGAEVVARQITSKHGGDRLNDRTKGDETAGLGARGGGGRLATWLPGKRAGSCQLLRRTDKRSLGSNHLCKHARTITVEDWGRQGAMPWKARDRSTRLTGFCEELLDSLA